MTKASLNICLNGFELCYVVGFAELIERQRLLRSGYLDALSCDSLNVDYCFVSQFVVLTNELSTVMFLEKVADGHDAIFQMQNFDTLGIENNATHGSCPTVLCLASACSVYGCQLPYKFSI